MRLIQAARSSDTIVAQEYPFCSDSVRFRTFIMCPVALSPACGRSECSPSQLRRGEMLKNGPTITATVLLSGAAAAMIALSSPAFARGGGHHQGECGERYSGHECGHFDHGEHHLR